MIDPGRARPGSRARPAIPKKTTLAFYWSGERFGCVIAGKVDHDLVLRIAEIVYQ